MDKLIILGHENPDVDSIISGYLLEKILKKKGYYIEFIIPDQQIEKQTLNICKKNGLDPTQFKKEIDLSDINQKYILVDHNTRNLSGKIVCIIDHHPTNKKFELNNYYNTNISSTACYICKDNEHLLDKFDLKLAIIATLVDTASFHSNKSRDEDRKWVINLCNKYNLNYNELYEEGLCLSSLSDISKASLNGLKKYNLNGKHVESSYIQIKDPSEEQNKINKIITLLKKRINDFHIDAFVFIVHNMSNFKTMYYLITKNKVEIKHYEIYASRGNTIIPEIEKIIIEQ